jgi:hypothetical protein
MKLGASLAIALAWAYSLDAQIAVTIGHTPEGLAGVQIRNNAAVSLVAFAISVKESREIHVGPGNPLYFDAEIDPGATELPANQERVVRVGGPIATAGIFADGSTTGDAVLLTRLALRRSNFLLAVETALEELANGGRQGASLYQLIVQFKKMTDSLYRWYLPPEQQIGLRIYEPILGTLMHMPKAKEGSPDPLAAFLEEGTATLRQQRVKLSESQPRLAEMRMLH